MKKNLLLCCLATFVAGAAAAGPADDVARVDVLPGWRMPDGTHMAGLRITMKPGWKTYWRAPGDGGIPPQFFFDGSTNIDQASPQFPVPRVFDQNGLRSIGYADSVVFPMKLELAAQDAATQMTGEMLIGVCQEICVPVTLQFNAALPADGTRDSAITAALLDQPVIADAQVATCALDPMTDGVKLTAQITVPQIGAQEAVVIEADDPNVWVSEADVTRQGDQLNATVEMVHTNAGPFALDRSNIRITVLGGGQAVDIHGCRAG